MFLTFGSVPAARSGLEKENSTPIELPSYLPEDLPVEKSAKVSCHGRWINAHIITLFNLMSYACVCACTVGP